MRIAIRFAPLALLAGCGGDLIDLDDLDVVGLALSTPNTEDNLWALTVDGALVKIEDNAGVNYLTPVDNGVVVISYDDNDSVLIERDDNDNHAVPFEKDAAAQCAVGDTPDGGILFSNGLTWDRSSGEMGETGFGFVQALSGPVAFVGQVDADTLLHLDTDARHNIAVCNGNFVTLSDSIVAVDDCSEDWLLDMSTGARTAGEETYVPLNHEAIPVAWGGAVSVAQGCVLDYEGGDNPYGLCHIAADGTVTKLSTIEFDVGDAGGRWCDIRRTLFATDDTILVAELDAIHAFDADGTLIETFAEDTNIQAVSLSGTQLFWTATDIGGSFAGGTYDIETGDIGALTSDGQANFDVIVTFGSAATDPGPDPTTVKLTTTPTWDAACLTEPETSAYVVEVYDGSAATGTPTDSETTTGPAVSFVYEADHGAVTAFGWADQNGDSIWQEAEPSGEFTVTLGSDDVTQALELVGCAGEGTADAPEALTVGTAFAAEARIVSTSFFSVTPGATDVHTVSLYGATAGMTVEWSLYSASDFATGNKLMTCTSSDGGYISADICNTGSLTSGTAYYLAVTGAGTDGDGGFSLVVTEGANSQPFLGTPASPSSIGLDEKVSFVSDVNSGRVSLGQMPSAKSYGFYLTDASGDLTLSVGRYDTSFVSGGNSDESPAASNDRYNAYILPNDVGTFDIRAQIFNSTGGSVDFDLEVRQGLVGGTIVGTGPALTIGTPTNVSGTFNTFYQFTPTGTAATIKLTDLTAGAIIEVYDDSDTKIAGTTGDQATDFSNELVIASGLTAGSPNSLRINGANTTSQTFGTVTITEP